MAFYLLTPSPSPMKTLSGSPSRISGVACTTISRDCLFQLSCSFLCIYNIENFSSWPYMIAAAILITSILAGISSTLIFTVHLLRYVGSSITFSTFNAIVEISFTVREDSLKIPLASEPQLSAWLRRLKRCWLNAPETKHHG